MSKRTLDEKVTNQPVYDGFLRQIPGAYYPAGICEDGLLRRSPSQAPQRYDGLGRQNPRYEQEVREWNDE
ncbi:hypothetical protein HZC31_01095 [Candidatus Woesearchaeota archaeon]|nr:hypothetical protein [Candidatus Woesearchaeota archaeon]